MSPERAHRWGGHIPDLSWTPGCVTPRIDTRQSKLERPTAAHIGTYGEHIAVYARRHRVMRWGLLRGIRSTMQRASMSVLV